MPKPDLWSDERTAQLKELFALGLSHSQIAARMGGWENSPDKGRNAVIGKARRLGLTRAHDRVVKAKVRQVRTPNNLKAVAQGPTPPVVLVVNNTARTPRIIPRRRMLSDLAKDPPLGDRMSPFPAPVFGQDGFGLAEINAIRSLYFRK